MRILDKDYYKRLYADPFFGTILRTPPPDFTELDRICDEFEKRVAEMHRREAVAKEKGKK